jgi:hypothetical protein
MEKTPEQGELFALIWFPRLYPFRLRANDLIRINGRLCRVLRVTESAAVVVMNSGMREFLTRFDKPVRFQPPPKTFRISANSEVEILNRTRRKSKRRVRNERRAA